MKQTLFVFNSSTEHSVHFLLDVIRCLSAEFEIYGSYWWTRSLSDVEMLKPYHFYNIEERLYSTEVFKDLLWRIKPAYIICWNKHYWVYKEPLDFINTHLKDSKVVFAEAGWFPQREYIYFDKVGINADSSIAALSSEDISRIDYDPLRLEDYKARYRKGMEVKNGEFIFCPLQVPADTNIERFSPWRDMSSFIKAVASRYRDEEILFKPHPSDPQESFYADLQHEMPNIRIEDGADLKWCLANCKHVVGINSTVLLEALMFDKKATYLGEGIGSNKAGVFNYDLDQVEQFRPDSILVDKFLYELIFNRQIPIRNPDRSRIWDYFDPSRGKAKRGVETCIEIGEEKFTPRVSIVMPCFNCGEYFKEAIDSVLQQTTQNFEIIVVDDGSTDERTKVFLSDYREPHTTVYRIERGGLANARNFGISKARAPYVLCLDVDGFLEPTCIEKASHALDEKPGIGMVSFWHKVYGSVWSECAPASLTLSDVLVGNRSCGNSMFRKEAWKKLGGYDKSLRWGYEDWEFWIRMLQNGHGAYLIHEFLFRYLSRPDSMAMCGGLPKSEIQMMEAVIDKHSDLFNDNLAAVLLGKERCIGGLLFAEQSLRDSVERQAVICKKHERQIAELLESEKTHRQQIIAYEEEIARLKNAINDKDHELRSVYLSKVWRVGCAFKEARHSLARALLLPFTLLLTGGKRRKS